MILIPPLHDYALSHHCCHDGRIQWSGVWKIIRMRCQLGSVGFPLIWEGSMDSKEIQGNQTGSWGEEKHRGWCFPWSPSLPNVGGKCVRRYREARSAPRNENEGVSSREISSVCLHIHIHIHTYTHTQTSMHMYYILYIPQSSLLSNAWKYRLLRSLGRCHHGKMKWNCYIMKLTICGTALLWNLHLCQCQANLKLGDL